MTAETRNKLFVTSLDSPCGRQHRGGAGLSRTTSGWPNVQGPHQPIRIAPLRFALDDEGMAIDRELIARAWARNLARSYFEGRGLGMDARLAEPDDRVGALGD